MTDYRQDLRDRVLGWLRANGAAWSHELIVGLHLAPTIIDEVIADLKGDGLIFRPERTLEDGVTFDRWRLAGR